MPRLDVETRRRVVLLRKAGYRVSDIKERDLFINYRVCHNGRIQIFLVRNVTVACVIVFHYSLVYSMGTPLISCTINLRTIAHPSNHINLIFLNKLFTAMVFITKNIFSEKVSDLIYIDIGHMSINFSDYIRIEGSGAWC